MLSIETNKETTHVEIEARNSAEVIADIGMAMRGIYHALKEKKPDIANEVKTALDELGVTVFMEDDLGKTLAKRCLEALLRKLGDDEDDEE